MNKLTIGTLNSRGMNSNKIRGLENLVKRQHLSILYLQETHDKKKTMIDNLGKALNIDVYICRGTQSARGVIIGINKRANIRVLREVYNDNNGNILALECEFDDCYFMLINYYASSNAVEQVQNLKKIRYICKNVKNYQIILGGDFNSVESRDLDRNSTASNDAHKNVNIELKKIKEEHNLRDVFRTRHPLCQKFIFRATYRNIKSRIDRIYVSSLIYDRIYHDDMLVFNHSDHDCYFFDIKTKTAGFLDKNLKRENSWKYNEQILNDTIILNKFEEMWEEWLIRKVNYTSQTVFWKHSKNKIISWLKKEGKKRVDIRKKEREILERRLKNEIDNETCDSDNSITELIKKQLALMDQEELKGQMVRSRVEWEDLGEKPTSYFYNLEKQNQQNKNISVLIDEDGKRVDKIEDIKEVACKFYEALYTSHPTDPDSQQRVLNFINARVTDSDSERMQELVSESEVFKIVKNIKKNKSPGSDGLTIEFYIQTWHIIGRELTETINNTILGDSLPNSWNEGVVTLIYKDKGDAEEIKNYRPITFLNVDYKIMTRILDFKIKPVLPYLIHVDQACGIKGRNITDQLITLQETIETFEQKNKNLIITSLDMEKAYDLINHDYLYNALQRYGFPPLIINWIKNICSNRSSCLKINSSFTRKFNLTRSCRQGDPCSTSLYLLALEPLAEMFRQSVRIYPPNLPNSGFKTVIQYADDTSVLSRYPESFNEIINIVSIFEKGAGARLNKNKTEVLIIGDQNKLNMRYIPEQNRVTCTKLLGMHVGENAMEKNFIMVKSKIQKDVDKWKNRPMTIEGKVLLIKSVMVPKLQYIMRVKPFRDEHLKQFDRMFSNFIWDPGGVEVAYSILQNQIEDGGRNAPNLSNIQKALLLERLSIVLNATERKPWEGLLKYRLGITLRKIHPNFNKNILVRTCEQSASTAVIQSTYYQIRERIKSWEDMNYSKLKNILYKSCIISNLPDREWKTTFLSIQNSTASRTRRELSYMIAINRIWIAGRLTSVNVDRRCKICKDPVSIETINHLFVECKWIQTLREGIRTKLANKSFTSEEILHHNGLISFVEHNITSMYKRAIWLTRSKRIKGLYNVKSDCVTQLARSFNRILIMDSALDKTREATQ